MLPFQQGFLELVDVVYKLLVGTTAIVGIVSLFKWRFELIGRNKFTIARRLILLALRYREEFNSARFPLYDPSEFADRIKHVQETAEETDVLNREYLKKKRVQRLQITHRQLHEAGWEAEVIFGSEIAELVKPFEDSYYHLWNAIHIYYRYELSRVRKSPDTTPFPWEMVEEARKMVWGVDDEPSKAIDNQVDKLKECLKKYIQ